MFVHRLRWIPGAEQGSFHDSAGQHEPTEAKVAGFLIGFIEVVNVTVRTLFDLFGLNRVLTALQSNDSGM